MATIFERRNRLLEKGIEALTDSQNDSVMKTRRLPTLIPNDLVGLLPHKDFIYDGFRTGQGVPGYRKKLREGRNAVSPYVFDRVVLLASDPLAFHFEHEYFVLEGNREVVYYSASYDQSGFVANLQALGDVFIHPIATTSADEAQALSEIYSKIRQDQEGINGLLFLGEFRELVHMLRNPLESARKGVTKYLETLKSTRLDVRRKVQPRRSDTNRSLTERRLNAVKNGMAGSWLELQFGLLPAISDAKDILAESTRLAYEIAPQRRSKLVGRSYGAPYGIVHMDAKGVPITESLKSFTSIKKVSTVGVQYVVGIDHTLTGPTDSIDGALRRLGFDISNFVPTIYELIPWSFLVDYFVNLGDIVEAACTDTTNVSWISKTILQDTVITCEDGYSVYKSSNWRPGACSGKSNSSRSFRHVTMTRSKPSSLGLPPLVLSLPGIDSKKWINMAALLGAARDFRFRGI